MCNCNNSKPFSSKSGLINEYELLPEFESPYSPYQRQLYEYETPVIPPPTKIKYVDPNKVSCHKLNRSYPIFKAIGTTDPVGVLDKIVERSVEMLDNTISELIRVRERILAGEPVAWPVMSDAFASSLSKRMRLNLNNRSTWAGNGQNTVGLVIRWLTNIRKILAGRYIWYNCLGSMCGKATWAYVLIPQIGKVPYRINLCRTFWQRGPNAKDDRTHFEFQAQTLIHETSHIYYNHEVSNGIVTSDQRGRGPGISECISQFVAETNDSPLDPNFRNRCGRD